MRIFDVTETEYRALRKAPGKAVVVKLESDLGEEREIELYQQPGIASGPTPGDKIATINIRGYIVGVATQNYRVELDVQAGTTSLYSTSADGESLAARVDLTNDGEIQLNGDSKTFVTHAELDSALAAYASGIVSTLASGSNGGGPVVFAVPAPSSIDISAAATTTVKTGG